MNVVKKKEIKPVKVVLSIQSSEENLAYLRGQLKATQRTLTPKFQYNSFSSCHHDTKRSNVYE
jgi:hypothetical protein